ncbi:diguanylate cyclase domain-containing protein [Photobacterium aphoticum]|nr:GGDEF domain-containing protein [Photobacterium aphoticum]PSU54986.1 sensor domain-containing diguanylate cyclase [Photobacterium aphoticum]GHA51231.1 diguanylate cyclase [Photobacterium aphoticum]
MCLLSVAAPVSAATLTDYADNPILMTAGSLLATAMCGALLMLLLHHIDARSFRKLQSLLTHMPVAVAIIRHKDGQLIYSNRPCRELVGARKLNGRYLYPESLSAAMVRDFLRPFPYRSSGFDQVTDQIFLAQGKRLPLAITGRPVRCNWQDCWLLYMKEANSPHREAGKMEQDQRLFQQVLNSLSELVYYQDKSGELMGTNKAFDRFWRGRFEEGICNEPMLDHGRYTPSHTWTTAPDGASRLLETKRNALVDDSGEVIGTLSLSHDVTDWYEMQEALKSEIEKREITEQELAQRNTLLDTILSASRDPIGLYNEHEVYVGCNEAFARSLGHTPQSLLGKTAEEVLNPELLEFSRQADQTVIEQGISVKADDYVILEDGTPIWYEVLKSPYQDPTDGTRGVLMMARDVTERKMAEQQLADAIMELQELSFVDSLTKVANRRSFDEQLRKLWFGHIREQQPLTLILCDIDYFKPFNDNYGHQQGDVALREVAQVLRSVIRRETDEVARYGGEEFAFLLPNTPLEGGELIAAKIHQALADKALVHQYSQVSDHLTVSLGIATIVPLPNQDYGTLVALADAALYKAKAAGRNCTMSMTDTTPDTP